MKTNETMATNDLLVADVMTIDPIVVGMNSSVEDATHLLRSNSITGLPVVDEGGALVGVISQTDLVTAADSPVGRVIRGNATGLRVGELMSAPAVTIAMTRPLIDAARIMLDRRIHRLVALDEVGRPVGVLSSMDFVALYASA